MAYIMALNPLILSAGGFDKDSVFVATVLATSIACFIMAFHGKTWPIGLAPGMGLNAFVAFVVCGAMGFSPQEALAAVLVAGILFLIISLTPIRAWIINSIPRSLKLGIGAGIGLFLAIIGFEIMGLTVTTYIEGVPWEFQDPTLIKLGGLKDPIVLIGLAALITMFVLDKMKVKGSIIISLIVWSIVAWIAVPEQAKFYGRASWTIPTMTHWFDFDFSAVLSGSMVAVIFTLFFVDFFDTAGTLTSVANIAGKIDSKGKVQDIEKAMLADSVGTVAGAVLGTTTVTSYVESGAGVKEGGRTGMTSLVIGVLFLACIFFSDLATSIPKQVDGAALIFVAVLFVKNIVDIEWDDIAEAGPAVLAMIAMPLTYSISNGIAIAFVSYALIKICTGKVEGVSPAIWIVAVLSALNLFIYS
jgi:AGZA family xanthine/uracil permease-like MFS transporter